MGNKEYADAVFGFYFLQKGFYCFGDIYDLVFFLCGDGDCFHVFLLI